MSNLLDDIEGKAATLSTEERAALALYLIESLDAEYPTQAGDWESTWLRELYINALRAAGIPE